jgi:magnesium chelatase family protein
MNPCPCGFYNHPTKNCSCSKKAIHNYIHRISGPLLDRIDLHVEVNPVDYKELASSQLKEKSCSILESVVKARAIQTERYVKDKGIYVNRQMNVNMIKEYCAIEDTSQQLLQEAMRKLQLSARSYHRILKVSRTIADLSESRDIQKEHIAEAIQYRSLDREHWGA